MPNRCRHRGVQVVDLDFVFNRFVSVLIGCPVNCSTFDAATGQPQTETERIMIATVAALGKWCPPKLAGPDDERFFEQSPLFQIGQQRTDALVDGRALSICPFLRLPC